jgi:dihydrofolate reductase
VVAVAENDVIGKNDALPWRLPDDLKRFKLLTMGKPIIMGRKTFASIGKALSGRLNIVISRQPALAIEDCTVCSSFDEALRAAGSAEEVCVIGGAEIYRAALSRADAIYLTRVHAVVDGDTYFPSLPADQWQEIAREDHAADDRHAYSFSFLTLLRRS